MCKSDGSGSCESCSPKSKAGAYFYIEFLGIKEREIDTSKMLGETEDSSEDWKKALGESKESPFGDLPKKFKMPEGEIYGTTIFSDVGLFIPSAIVDYLKKTFDVDKISFQLIHEISKEAYVAELDYQENKAKYEAMFKKAEDELKKRLETGKHTTSDKMRENALPYSVNEEIENLVGQVEAGRLHVVAPDADEPEFEEEPTDDSLLNSDFKFDDEDGDDD